MSILRIPDVPVLGLLPLTSQGIRYLSRARKSGIYWISVGEWHLAAETAWQQKGQPACLTLLVGSVLPTPSDEYAVEDSPVRDVALSIGLDGDGKRAVLFRDWMGASALYAVANRELIAFATRVAPLVALGIRVAHVLPVPPGSLCELSQSGLRIRRRQRFQPLRLTRSQSRLIKQVRKVVEQAVARVKADRGVVMLSGGADSTILAYLLKDRIRHLEAVVLSVRCPNSDTPDAGMDLPAARRVAEWLGIQLHEVLLSPSDAVRVAPSVVGLAETRRASVIDELAGMYHVARYLGQHGFPVAYSGEGPDDIFGGLEFELRFTALRELHSRMMLNLTRELPFELAAAQKLFSAVGGVRLIHPFLYRPLVNLGLGIPPRLLIDRQRKMKVLFRSAFADAVPAEFLWRAKAITRVATGLKSTMERAYGSQSTRYYRLYRDWLSSLPGT